ncbi:hypothetical protein [Paraflavitalea speifideaquila]|uniref:hypothetical protein n=1 Tax=Paraflavitalea speifideaquila TaxID=3076558 RepID=UPI0028E4005E|nr:hypothetical protein [Paraflavitalea speifideiaquila]
MSKKRKHTTTKNTMAKPPVTKLMILSVECNGRFDLVTDFPTEEAFDKIFREWYDHPDTKMWCAESLIMYIKAKQPKRICLLREDYDKITKGKVIPATKEEWEAENN